VGRDANREEEATWHTQAQRTLLPSFPTPLFLLGIWSALSLLVGCGRREKQVTDVIGGVWWALVSSVYARCAPEHPTTYQTSPGPGSRWARDLRSLPFLSILSQDLGNPGFQKNPVVGAHRQVCAPRGGGTRKRGHSAAGQTKRSKPSSHLSQNPPERLRRSSSSSFLPSR